MEKKSEILEELKQWQSPLAEMPRSMPFEVPENYFSTLSDSITASIQCEDAPLQWNDRTPYTVPENYFSSLPQDILAKAKQTESIKVKKTIALPVFVKMAAAVLVIALSISGYQYLNTEHLTTSEQLAQLPEEEIDIYLDEHKIEINTDILAYEATAINVGSLDDIDDETIVAYLDDDGWYSVNK